MISADLICFSHLRWNFVFQRPNHLMTRCAKERRVLFVEEPLHDEKAQDRLEIMQLERNLLRVVPHLRTGRSAAEELTTVTALLSELCAELAFEAPVHWLYTPMMLPISDALPRGLLVYDCMDELSNFLYAPPELRAREAALIEQADVMFTGGMALYEHKRHLHPNVHGVPSSVDTEFFWQARDMSDLPPALDDIPEPRIGFVGVLDERLDLALLRTLAERCPESQLVMIGPIAKIKEEDLPRLPNIHYLGRKSYDELPGYLAGLACAIMPFALNEATRFISPTKTPEYLAAGLPVVSTAIQDVVEPYERLSLVQIGRTHDEFVAHVQANVDGRQRTSSSARDAFLANISWDATWARMSGLLRDASAQRAAERRSEETSQVIVLKPKGTERDHAERLLQSAE